MMPNAAQPPTTDLDSNGHVAGALRTMAGPNLVGVVYNAGPYTAAREEVLRQVKKLDTLSARQFRLRQECARLVRLVEELEGNARDEASRRAGFEARRDLAHARDKLGSGDLRFRTAVAVKVEAELKAQALLAAIGPEEYRTDLLRKMEKIVNVDVAFFVDSPGDCPDELTLIYKEVVRVSENIDRLSGSTGSLKSFWSGCSDALELVLESKLGVIRTRSWASSR